MLVALLMLLVGYQLLRLARSLRRGVFGSRLALRLVLLFALVAVLPGALVYGVSVQFLVQDRSNPGSTCASTTRSKAA